MQYTSDGGRIQKLNGHHFKEYNQLFFNHVGTCICKLSPENGQKSPGTVKILGGFCLPWFLRLGLLCVTTRPSLWLGPGLSIRVAAIVFLGIPASIGGEIWS